MAKKKQREAGGKAVIYARYSSHNQREASLEQQIAECKQYAERNGYKIIDIYQDAAVSGRTDDRPEFKRMMHDARKEKFDFIIAWKSNRIGRNMHQTLANMAKLSDYGVECLYVEEDFDNTASGRFALRNMMNVNQFYSENMAEDITRGLLDNAQKCMVNCRLPFGYKKGEDGKFAIDEPNAAIVRQMFKRIRSDWTISDIRDDLNSRGIKTRNGNPWSFSSFNKILQNEQYTGIYKYSGVRIEGGIPVIIEKAEFEEVQKILTQKKRPRGKQRENADYLLTGKCFCGMCGSPMVALAGTSKNGTKHCYYACSARRYDHTCEKQNVPKDFLEKLVAENIREELHREGLIDGIVGAYEKVLERAKEESKINSLQADLDAVNKSLDNIMKAIEAGLFNEVTKARMDELIDTRRDIEEAIRLEKAVTEIATADEVRKWLEGLRDGDIEKPEYIKELIRVFLKAVYVYDDKLTFQYHYGAESTVTMPHAGNGEVFASSSPSSTIIYHREHRFFANYFEVDVPIPKRGSTV